MPVPSAEDRLAIADVFTTYAHAVDSADWALYRQVFTKDAVVDYCAAGGKKGTADEITAWMRSVFLWIAGQHLVSNIDVRQMTVGSGVQKDTCHVRAMFHNPCNLRLVPWPRPFFCVGEPVRRERHVHRAKPRALP